MKLSIALRTRPLLVTLSVIGIVLVALSIIADLVKVSVNYEMPTWEYELAHLFDVSEENNIPTWFESALLLGCAVALAGIASAKRAKQDRHARHWTLLAVLFALFSLDEIASLHEQLTHLVREDLNLTGWLYFSWIIFGAAFVVVFALYYLRFFLSLPRRTRTLFLVAAVIYVGAALGFEALGSHVYYEEHYVQEVEQVETLTYVALTTTEEALEAVGVLLFLYALLDYLRATVTEIDLTIVQQQTIPDLPHVQPLHLPRLRTGRHRA